MRELIKVYGVEKGKQCGYHTKTKIGVAVNARVHA